jgi:ribosomal protein S18 acetylase RimI-like enzyme
MVRLMAVSEEVDGLVAPARNVDHQALLESLAVAFADDPVAAWNCPRQDLRKDFLKRFFGVALDMGMPHGEVWTDASRTGAAIWLPPDQSPIGLLAGTALIRPFLTRHLLTRIPAAIAGGARIDARHPQEPHWYLFVLGVAPAGQGRGLGSRLLAPVIERCDEDQVGAYLESSKQSNIAFYARHGFRVTGEVALPSGPTVYCMWRDPR